MTARPFAEAPAWRVTRLFAVLVLSMLFVGHAAAQEEELGPLAGPMTSVDVDRMHRHLGLSLEQRLIVDQHHARYLDTFLTDQGDTSWTLTVDLELEDAGEATPGAADRLRDLVRRRRGLENRMTQRDEVFLQSIAEVLNEDQRTRLESIRTRRAFDRTRTLEFELVSWPLPAAASDHAGLLDTLDLTADERRRLEPLADAHRLRVAAMRRQVQRNAEALAIAMLDLAESLADQLDEESRRSPAEQLWPLMQERIADLARPVLGDLASIVRFNREAIDEWRSLVRPEIAEQLRRAHFANKSLWDTTTFERVRWHHDEALRLDGLDDALRDGILALRETFMMDAFDRLARLEAETLADMRSARLIRDFEESNQRVGARSTAFDAFCEQAGAQLADLLGPEAAERIRAGSDRDAPDEGRALGAPERQPWQMTRPAMERYRTRGPVRGLGSAPLLAGPVTAAEMDQYAFLLGADAGQRLRLEEARRQHEEAYADVREAHATPLTRMLLAIRRTMGPQATPEILAAGQAAAASLGPAVDAAALTPEQLDTELMRSIERIMDGAPRETLDSVVALRRRTRLTMLGDWSVRSLFRLATAGRPWQSHDHDAIDLDRLLVDAGARVVPSGRDDLMPLMTTYRTTREHLVRTLRMQRLAWLARTPERAEQVRAARQDPDRAEAVQHRLRAEAAALNTAWQAVVDLDAQTMTELRRLDPALGDLVHDRYLLLAFPEAFTPAILAGDVPPSTRALEPILASLTVPDLRTDQRDRLRALLAEYRERYRILTRPFVERLATWHQREAGRGPLTRVERIEGERMEFVRIIRSELDARTLRRLRSILDEEQARAVGFASSG